MTATEQRPVPETVDPDAAAGWPTRSRRDADRARGLAELSSKLAEAIGNTDDVLDSVVRLVAGFLGGTAVVRLLSEDRLALRVVATHDDDEDIRKRMAMVVEAAANDVASLVPYATAVREAQPVLLSGAAFEAATPFIPPLEHEVLHEVGVHTLLICPLRARGRVIGSLSIWRRAPLPVFTERDQQFAQELADRAALAIVNARLVEQLRAEIEERTRSEENLRLTAELLQRADGQRRALVEHLVSAQEEERQRIALDVHDDSIQAMAAVGIRLRTLRRHSPDQSFADSIAEIEDVVTETIARLRNLLFQLEAGSLEKAGLAQSVKRYLGEMFPDGGVRVRIRNRLDSDVPSEVRVIAYRILQEAVTNIRKHANAREVLVTLGEEHQGLQVSIEDDGVGFESDSVQDRALPGHLGLRAMRERADMAGGTLAVTSSLGAGTRVRLWLPLPPDEL